MITPASLFSLTGIASDGSVDWGEAVPEPGPGVYLIAVPDPVAVRFDGPFGPQPIHWLSDQPIVYIGRSKHLARRLVQFYRHIYGARSPHHGGQDALLISSPKRVYWFATHKYLEVEHDLIDTFVGQVGRLPFANKVRPPSLVQPGRMAR